LALALHEPAAPLSFTTLGATGALREIDELVRDAEARGFVFVQSLEGPGVLHALSRHIERRARALGRPFVKVDGLPTDDPWRELVARFPPATPLDTFGTAQAVIDRAGPALLLVREGAPTHFGRALTAELARCSAEGSARALVIALGEAPPPAALIDEAVARLIEVSGDVAGDDLQTWWEAVARDPGHRIGAGLDRLDALEAWWTAARATPLEGRALPVSLGPDALRLLARLALSQRSWLAAQIGRLGLPAAAAQDLVRAGALALDTQGRLVAGPAALPELSASLDDAADALAVADALEGFADPWAAARASELYASAGAFEQAEVAAARAVSAFADPSARADFWGRWGRTLAALPEAEALPRLLRSADLALRSGDVERALELGSAALSKRPESFSALLAVGRANVARGDLSTATYWLGKAGARAEGSGVAGAAAMVEVELAEVCHLEGDLDRARRHAGAAIATSADAATCLHARNVIGKLLLAESAWKEAEAHFAADACEAALSSDLAGELRARLNRSIALLSSGRLDEARGMLSEVLGEGEARGELRAVAYALSNLAIIANLKREYLDALRLSERAFDARRRLGDKLALGLLITNLAELKLQLGMVSEAEQTLAFGRQASGPGTPGGRVSHFAYTAALIHLERGRTVEAGAELKIAVSMARESGHGGRLGECYRLAARVALEDGDLTAAATALAHAAGAAESPRECAWVAVLETARARAAGEPFADAAEEALEKARASGDPEVLREAHVISHHAAALDGDAATARAHLDAAAAMRDQIADTLPEDLRSRFLARRDLTELSRLQAAAPALLRAASPAGHDAGAGPKPSGLRAPASFPRDAREHAPAAPSRRSDAPASALRRMVGRTPAMLALATAIQKVGQSDATVLVHGESGTGKELVAEAIHEASSRRTGPIVKVNCAALVETLLLSELFGHEKGSFTGAAARRRGRFEVAEGGTLFLDEIGDISPRTQVALLRVLQDKTFERVGGVTPIRANVRIVCATHRDLGAMVTRGDFREDLYYRLRGVVLEVPALRQRVADMPHVVTAILERIAAERGTVAKRLSTAALDGLAQHTWPGNVRELENALRAAALFADADVIELEDFTSNVEGLRGLTGPACPPPPPTLSSASVSACAALQWDPPITVVQENGTDGALEAAAMMQPSKIAPSSSGDAPGTATEVAYAAIRGGVSLSELKRDIERECIARALAETGGNITRAAGLLGMKRPRLSQLVKQYGFGAVDDGVTSGLKARAEGADLGTPLEPDGDAEDEHEG
jgi:DNA-binding NtrC family response regulator